MAKKDQPTKRAALIEQLGRKPLTVGELRQLLATFPDDWPVTGYNGQEETDFVTCGGVTGEQSIPGGCCFLYVGAEQYFGPYVDIMGV